VVEASEVSRSGRLRGDDLVGEIDTSLEAKDVLRKGPGTVWAGSGKGRGKV